MNLQQLVEEVSKREKVSAATAESMIKATVFTIKNAVKKGDDVKIVGFGTFVKAKRKARMGRNPQTGASIKIPARWSPKFRVSDEFKKSVR